ncbi:Nucleolar protein [Phytophthora palmivora]|uniref:Nucleolar protein n=1 Tax=Phytophthora palmivora TaxID=4796 RepID=A0A2P4XM26_9STRA|nr:Nucleolar protein [Phytophthora palmivora]
MGTQFPANATKANDFAATCKQLVIKLATHVGEKELQEAADEAAMDMLANRLPPPAEKKKNDGDSGPSPLDGNVTIRFKNRSHIRLSMGEDEMKEAFVAVYYSLHNCRRHHMGLCTCNGGDEEDEEGRDDGDDDGEHSDAGEASDIGSADGDREDGDNESDVDEDDPTAALGQMPPKPNSVVFPGELAPALLKLYTSSASTPGASIDKLAETVSDETAVRGMLLRLWSEGLLDVSTQS